TRGPVFEVHQVPGVAPEVPPERPQERTPAAETQKLAGRRVASGTDDGRARIVEGDAARPARASGHKAHGADVPIPSSRLFAVHSIGDERRGWVGISRFKAGKHFLNRSQGPQSA